MHHLVLMVLLREASRIDLVSRHLSAAWDLAHIGWQLVSVPPLPRQMTLVPEVIASPCLFSVLPQWHLQSALLTHCRLSSAIEVWRAFEESSGLLQASSEGSRTLCTSQLQCEVSHACRSPRV